MVEPGMLQQMLSGQLARGAAPTGQSPSGMAQMMGAPGRMSGAMPAGANIGAGRPSNAPIQGRGMNNNNGMGMQMLALLMQAMTPRRTSFENQPSAQAQLEELAAIRNERDRAVRDKTNPVRGEWQR